jgi:hypothetical protein
MNIPGFAADASLYKTSMMYSSVGAFSWHGDGLRMQLLIWKQAPGRQSPSGGGSYSCNTPDAMSCNYSCYDQCTWPCFPNCTDADIAKCVAKCHDQCCWQ